MWRLYIAGLALLVGFSNCSRAQFSKVEPGKFICDPTSSGGGDSSSGLKGDIFYLTNGSVAGPGDDVQDYYSLGTKVPNPLYMSSVNVPTRPFDKGFKVSDNSYVTNQAGETLIEWFALRMRARLKLGPGDAAGKYQLAVLSDDGSRIIDTTTSADGGYTGGQVIVDNNIVTGTRLQVAPSYIELNSQSARLPIRFEYFQGPRVRIAAIILWRPWNGSAAEPLNNQAGDNYWFDTSPWDLTPPQPVSIPLGPYNDLIARGWKVLGPSNFELPDEGDVNPCQ